MSATGTTGPRELGETVCARCGGVKDDAERNDPDNRDNVCGCAVCTCGRRGVAA